MTSRVEFHAEEAMLWSVRYALQTYPDPEQSTPYAYIAAGAACILSLQAALEAIANSILEEQDTLQHWDELRLKSKIDTIANLNNAQIDWGAMPWQEISYLIRLRNWMAHNKERDIGLVGAEDCWLEEHKFNPKKELLVDRVRRFYDAVRDAGLLLAQHANQIDEYEFLVTEQYEPIVM